MCAKSQVTYALLSSDLKQNLECVDEFQLKFNRIKLFNFTKICSDILQGTDGKAERLNRLSTGKRTHLKRKKERCIENTKERILEEINRHTKVHKPTNTYVRFISFFNYTCVFRCDKLCVISNIRMSGCKSTFGVFFDC